jgi:hypothetical protein
MTTSTPPAAPEGKNELLQFVVVVLIVSLVSWIAASEWTDRGSRGAREKSPDVERSIPERLVAAPVTSLEPAPQPSRPAQPALLPVTPAPLIRAASSDLVRHVAKEATAGIDSLRSYIVSSCWPASATGLATAKLTFNLTFDVQGREIARGISEGRKASAPAHEFSRCLRRLEGTTLAIAPPGANVGVSIPVTFP